MKKYKLKNPILFVLTVFLFSTSCKGQTSTHQNTEKVNAIHKIEQKPKMMRTAEQFYAMK